MKINNVDIIAIPTSYTVVHQTLSPGLRANRKLCSKRHMQKPTKKAYSYSS
ncbi:hypothetical protein HYC85_025761 [Camellia sinensis]|uniref:Uncharacterized protein n=1 Tax=Camellia sinensis TaxID=4442 RepID=A0A7J7GD84_CAMSI|nr:hypothetical protein HYC85_025761 [Camellia sinensis]